MKIKQKVQIAFFLLVHFYGMTQNNQSSVPNVMPPSPTSMQFQRFGDYPVNSFTGVPSISIPLYTIKSGNITLPITLDYHASGCRPDDVSGFVGLGWSLNTGGMLTRTVIGLPDENGNGVNIPNQKAMNLQWTNFTTAGYLSDLFEGVYDHEFDLWNYSFLGVSGKYCKKIDGSFFKINANGIKIVNDGEIIDESGTKYLFGGDGIEYSEFTDPLLPSASKQAPTSFPLSSIQSATSSVPEITLGYQSGPSYVAVVPVNNYSFEDFWLDPYTTNSSNFPNAFGNMGGLNQSNYLMKNFTNVPREIYFNSGKIEFVQNSSTKMLDRIEIYDGSNNIIKKIQFVIQAFPTSHTPLTSFSNYKLSELIFTDANNNTSEIYSFNYNNESEVDAKPLAYSGTSGKDYWGFYNGDDGKISRHLSYVNFLTRDDGLPWGKTIGGNAIKAPSETYTKKYILNKITYPTGGYSEFEYESNRNMVGDIVGGLRITKIKNFDSDSKKVYEKAYSYLSSSSEVTPNIDHFVTSKVEDYSSGWNRSVTMTEEPYLNYSPQGSPIVYLNVFESDNINGSTSYSYDADNAYTYEELNYPSVIPSSSFGPVFYRKFANNYKPWNFGNLLQKSKTSTTGAEIEQNEYEEYIIDTLRDFVMDRWQSQICLINVSTYYNCNLISQYDRFAPLNGYSVFNFADRYYFSGGKRLKKSTTTSTGSNGQILTSIKEFFYENSQYPTVVTKIKNSNSKGEEFETILKYPFNFTNQGIIYTDMLDRNMLTSTIEKKINNLTSNKTVSKTITNYSYFQNNALILPASIQTVYSDNSVSTDVTLQNYDENGNIRQFTAKDGVVNSFIWGYNSQYPVAKIIGKSYSDALSQSGVNLTVINNPSSDAALRTELDKLRLLTNCLVSTYTYKPLVGITSETDPNGRTIYYEYDSFNRLKLIKDQDGKVLKVYDYQYQANTNQ